MLPETLEQRLQEISARRVASSAPELSVAEIAEAALVQRAYYTRRRLLFGKRWVCLKIGLLHSGALALLEEDAEEAASRYSGNDLRACLNEWRRTTSRMERDGYTTEDAQPQLNELLPALATIIRDRRDVRELLSF